MNNSPAPQTEADSAQIIDFRAIANWISFGLRAVRRRAKLVALIAGGMFFVAVVAVQLMPKTFRVQCRLLAQKNSALALRGDQGGEQATRSASDIVLRRENVIDLMKQTNLVEEWWRNRNFLQRSKDFVMKLFPPPTEEQKLAALTDFVLTKLSVYNDETSVTFQADWRDPVMAFKLADAAQRSFLNVKHVQEVSTLAEAVSILEGRAASVREEINASVTSLQALRERKQKEEKTKPKEKVVAPEPTPAPEAAKPAPAKKDQPPAESPEVVAARQKRIAELATTIDTKERALAELESTRMRRLSDLQAKLQDLKAVYTEQHPAVTDARQAIISATKEAPEASRLREELRQLRAESEQLRQAAGAPASASGGFRGGRPVGVTAAGGGLGDVIRIEQESAEERDPEIEYARSQLRFAITTYQALEDQIGKTVVDLKTAEAAFKYRYTMVTPPELPRRPISPNSGAIMFAALIGGLLIGVLAAIAFELKDGLLYARWQVEQGLSLRVLSSVKMPALLPGSAPGRGRDP